MTREVTYGEIQTEPKKINICLAELHEYWEILSI